MLDLETVSYKVLAFIVVTVEAGRGSLFLVDKG